MPRQEKMEEVGWYRTLTWHHSWTRELWPDVLPRLGDEMEEDGTELLTWHHSWTREEGDARQEKMEEDGTEP